MRRMLLRRIVALGFIAPLAVGCSGSDSEPADRPAPAPPYAGLEERRIRALAPQRAADLLAGRGAGYALAAELNHHPGPAHVLELGERLELTRAQNQAVRRLEATVHATARPLGRRLVALERELDSGFRSGAITRRKLASLTAEIARVEGLLRRAHLQAHLDTKRILTPAQVERYDELRGYATRPPGDDHPAGGHSG